MNKTKRVFIIYGYYGRPDQPWFQRLKEKLIDENVKVAIPNLPNPEKPNSNDWIDAIAKAIGKVDKNTYIVAHSLGCIAFLQYLDSLNIGSIGGAVLVAAFLQKLPTLPELDNFITKSIDIDHVKSVVGKVVVINSDDDPVVPVENAYLIGEKLNAEVSIIHNAGHIHEEFGITELPIALEKLNSIMRP